MDLDTLLTGRNGFALESATFLQRAICRVVDGAPLDDLLARGAAFDCRCLETALGCAASAIPVGTPPIELVDLEPVRCAKSLRMAALAVARSQTIDVSIIKPGEEPPRISILATQLDQASAIRGHLNVIHERPALRALFVGEDADSITLRHPTGLPIQIRVIAAQRGGYSLASRWAASVLFDEAPGWYSTDRIISLEESREQAMGRLLPGGQAYYAGSKWQPSGYCYSVHAESFGRPTSELVVISPQVVDNVAPATQLNPVYWTSETVARVKRTSPRTYRMHVLNEFGSAENSALDAEHVDRAFVSEFPAEAMIVRDAVCALDPSGLRQDAFTAIFAIWFDPPPSRESQIRMDRNGAPVTRVVEIAPGMPAILPERIAVPTRPVLWIGAILGFNDRPGSAPSFETVLKTIGEMCRANGIRKCVGDGFNAAGIAGPLSHYGVRYTSYAWTTASKHEAMSTIADLLKSRTLQITTDSPSSEILRTEMKNARFALLPSGQVSYRTNGLDYLSALMSLAHYLVDPDVLGIDAKDAHRADLPGGAAPNYRHVAPKHT